MILGNNYVTPIQQLGEKFNNNNLFMKREDLIPISFGGNKVRKALLFFQDFIEKNANCIVTYGASSSNHCRIIANIASANKIPCFIICPSESSYQTTNKKMVELFGASIIHCSISKVSDTINKQINELIADGYKPYFIEGGGHGNIGTQAYVKVFEEILEYEKTSQMQFDYIFHASGTGTTQAGLICGKLLSNDEKKIVGISNARKNPYGSKVILESVNDYMVKVDRPPIDYSQIIFIDDYILDGYGTYNHSVLEIIKKILITEGIPLDSTYTGKAFWGMTEYIQQNNIINKNILFIHTGGTPLFFNVLEEL